MQFGPLKDEENPKTQLAFCLGAIFGGFVSEWMDSMALDQIHSTESCIKNWLPIQVLLLFEMQWRNWISKRLKRTNCWIEMPWILIAVMVDVTETVAALCPS